KSWNSCGLTDSCQHRALETTVMLTDGQTFTALSVLLPVLLTFLLLKSDCATAASQTVPLSDSEARTVCTAKCLKTFKSKVAGRISEIIAANPALINRQCTEAAGNATLMDRLAVNYCQTCTFACMHYSTDTGKYSSIRSCSTFCTAVELDQGFEPRTCRQSCEALERLFSREATIGDSPSRPPRPRIEQVQLMQQFMPSKTFTSTANLDWSAGYSSPSSLSPRGEPLVFLVQANLTSSDSPTLQWSPPTWKSLAFTTAPRIRLNDLLINGRYLFRVGAVLPDGGISYSEASAQLIPSSMAATAELKDRRAIRKLREGSSSLGRCRLSSPVTEYCVDVFINWKLAKRVHRRYRLLQYEVSWFELETSGMPAASDVHRKFLTDVAQTSATVTGLKPSATYNVSLTALMIHERPGDRRPLFVKFNRAIRIVTMQVPKSLYRNRNRHNPETTAPAQRPQLTLNEDSDRSVETDSDNCSCSKKPTSKLVTKQPYYENGQLKMLLLWPSSVFETDSSNSRDIVNKYSVRWSQRVCIEAETIQNETRQTIVDNTLMLIISGLHFSCHYTLQFSGLTSTDRVAFTWNSCFCTGSCKETQIKGDKLPPCPVSEVAQTPQPPVGLSVLVEGTIARLDWSAPSYPPLRVIRNFRVRWGLASQRRCTRLCTLPAASCRE
ncbi:hypothetical protein BOX15_Mlig019415g2, partial [Macrostomum lignano]